MYKLLILTFKAFIDRTAPLYLCELIEQQKSSTNTRTRLANDKFPHPVVIALTPFLIAPSLMEPHVNGTSLKQTVVFKSEIKTVLFLRYFNS